MIEAPHLLLVYGRAPTDWTGTPVVLHRHLNRFEAEGWRVSVATYHHEFENAQGLPTAWARCALPMRRWWWLPYRRWIPGIETLRRHLFADDLARQVRANPPDLVLTVLEPYEAQIASDVARRLRCPLAVIVHDQPELFEDIIADPARRAAVRQAAERVLREATRVYPVTPALGAAYGEAVAAKSQTLLPIPAGGHGSAAQWRDGYACPHVVHVGSLHGFQAPNMWAVAEALHAVGGRLTLASHHGFEPFEPIARAFPNVVLRPAFPTSGDMLAYCAAEASAILVSYSFDVQAWGATSFPSRLVELTHLGLPLVLLAPPRTAASAWAREVGWTALVGSLDVPTLTEEMAALASRDGWEARAAESRRAAHGLFDPQQIHEGFARDLVRLTRS